MRKITCIGLTSIIVLVFFVGMAAAATTLGGDWQGTVKRVTEKRCDSLRVNLSLNQCSGANLARGTATVNGDQVKVVAKLDPTSKAVTINGSEFSGGESKSVIIAGKYDAGNPSRINVTFFDFFTTSSTGNEAFDVFKLTKE